MKRLAAARLWHEGNSFSPVPTTLADFEQREWVAGGEARRFYRDTATEMGAVVTFADGHPDWEVTFLRCAAAPPGGPVTDECYASLRAFILASFGWSEWDAVYLSLHGAMIAEDNPRPELSLLQDIRTVIGPVPLAISYDLHANLGPAVVALADFAIGYKTYPHTDMRETAAKAVRLLAQMVHGEIHPTTALAKADVVLTSFNMRTTDGPMAELQALAREYERWPGVLDATILGGFAYGDTPDAGAGALVTTDNDPACAQEIAETLAKEIRNRRRRFAVTLPSPAAGLQQALAADSGTVALLDPADNPLSGGIGDTPGLFRALLERQADVPCVFAFFCDPDVVAMAYRAGIGASLQCQLGARLTDAFGPSVEVAARVERLTGGRFRNEGPMETNLPVDLGRTAVLTVDSVQVIVTETCRAANDPAYFRLHGIDLAQTRLLCVKAKNHFRAAFAPLCHAILEVDCPGPASPDLSRYGFRHVPPHRLRQTAGASA